MANTIARILVPVDFSDCSLEAARYAAGLAGTFHASIELLHVIEEPFQSGVWSPDAYVPYVPELLTALRRDAERRLLKAKNLPGLAGLSVLTAVAVGRPSQAILDRAAEGDVDLIVMGTHGRTGVSHLMLGSVAERVLRRSPCPVLTVRGSSAAAPGARSAA